MLDFRNSMESTQEFLQQVYYLELQVLRFYPVRMQRKSIHSVQQLFFVQRNVL